MGGQAGAECLSHDGMLSGDWLEVKSSGAESLDDIVQEGVLGEPM